MSKMCIGLLGKYPLFLSNFNDTSVVSTEFQKIFKYQISWWETVQWVLSYSIKMDGQTRWS